MSGELVPDALRAKMHAASETIERLQAILAETVDEDDCRKLSRSDIRDELLELRADLEQYVGELQGLHFQYSGLAAEAINRAKREAGS